MAYESQFSKIVKAKNMETYVKAILYGANGTGKTSSVLASAPKPILVIDAELRVGIYSNVFDFEVFPSNNPEDILNLTRELSIMHQQGHPLPWKTILMDSGTEYYRYIKKFALDREREIQKNSLKSRLELNEWDMPKSMFYETFDNLKRLPVNFYCIAHTATNYLPSQLMKPDPSKPTRANLEKSAEHHFDLVAHFEKKGAKYKVTFEKNCLINKKGEQILPPVIDNVNNMDIIGTIHKMVSEQKGYAQPAQQGPTNVIRTNAKFESMLDEALQNTVALHWTNEKIVSVFREKTGYDNPDQLRIVENAEHLVSAFLDATRVELANASGEFDEV